MGKNQSASGLTNIVQYDNNGNISFVSGSTTLMQISSSGAITTTGVISGSNALSSSYALNSGLLNETGSVGFATTGSLLIISSSQQQISASQQQISSSLLALTASYNALSSSYTALSASYNTASSSFSTRITSDSSSLSSRTTQIENVYATTGSNTFTGTQNFSNTCTPNSFTGGASIYTAGGLRVTQDAYFSSSVYIKGNVTVFGTQSVSYISSSQLDIGTNIITVNTSTPSVRYGGLSVFDSGSTGLTGSIFWDSELNRWIYVNASGSGGGATYGGGMFISGPRNSVGLGCEQGTTACMLLAGQGGDHLTSSMIYHSSTVTCIPNTLIGSTICSTMANASCIGIGTTTPTTALEVSSADLNNIFVTNPTTTGTTTGAGIGFKAYNGTSVAQSAGIILTSNAWSYGTYSANQLSLGSDGTGGIALRTACSAPITFFTGCTTAGLSAERMRITSTGVVGIGTNAPVTDDGNLVVAGCVGTGQGAANTVAQINIWETTSANKAGLWFGSMTNATTGVIGSRTATGNIAFQTYCGGWAERMRIAYNGNLLLGSSTDYAGILQANGQISVIKSSGYGYIHYTNTTSNNQYFLEQATSGGFLLSTGKNGTCAQPYLALGTADSENMRIVSGGNVGIGCTTPSYILDVRDGTTGSAGGRGMRLSVCSNSAGPQFRLEYQCSGDSRNWLIGTNQETSGDFIIRNSTIAGCDPGGACSATRFSINKSGFVSIGGTDAGFKLDVQSPGCAGTAENVARIGNIPGTNNGLLIHRCADNSYRYLFQSGIMCVQNTICTGQLITNTGGLTENFDATGGGHINRYFAVKYMPENATTSFFKISTSGASVTYVHLAATNAGVGWYSSQVFHSGISAYWGGWVGSGTQISRVAGEAGYISGVHTDGSGNQTYCVIVANNGTSTSSLVFAYITTVTYGGYSTTFTQL